MSDNRRSPRLPSSETFVNGGDYFQKSSSLDYKTTPISKLKERAGLKIKAQYALIKCICKEKLIAKKDQQTRLCPFCGRRIWLADRRILFQSNNLALLKKLMRFRSDNGQCMGYYHPSFMLLSRFPHRSLSTAGVKRTTAFRNCGKSVRRRRMLEEREKYLY